jgi:hypothetical protein
MSNQNKRLIIDALDKWIRQRPGLDYANYGDVSRYRSELRIITRELSDARVLLRAVELRDSITAHDIVDASRHAYSGRLEIVQGYRVNGKGSFFSSTGAAQRAANKYLPSIVAIESAVEIDYCTGQYWPTEYRKAVCAVLASALWNRKRADMPDDTGKLSHGDWLRDQFRREYGIGISKRWFQ